MIKRGFDIVVSVLALAVTSPLLLVVAVLVKVESTGPVMFRQERVGRDGELFRIHKFRTMRVHATGSAVSPTGDPRVTRTGRLLRRSKLDEVPQLIDVLHGDMSVVGPRPELPRYVQEWPTDLRHEILSVRPGITDPVSIELRDESDLLAASEDPERYYIEVLLPRKAVGYADYVRTQSFRGDLLLVAHTVAAVVSRQ